MLSYKISPINSLEEFLATVTQDSSYIKEYFEFSRYLPETIQLREAEGEKEIFLVMPIGKSVPHTEVIDFLQQQGLKPCENSPNYLLGLLKTFIDKGKYPDEVFGHEAAIACVNDQDILFDSVDDTRGKDCTLSVVISYLTMTLEPMKSMKARCFFHPNAFWILAEKTNSNTTLL